MVARAPLSQPVEPDCAQAHSVQAALYRLQSWLSPAYPVGAYAFSSGIEWSVEAGDIRDADTLRGWLTALLTDGAGFCDAVLFTHTWRAVTDHRFGALHDIAELGAAFCPSKERFLETTAQGRAFLDVTMAAWSCAALERFASSYADDVVYPVAVAVACAGHDIPLESALIAYLHALAGNWVSAGARLIPLGQTDCQRVIADLEKTIFSVAARAQGASLDDMGSATIRADIASMRHETQYTRLFRS